MLASFFPVYKSLTFKNKPASPSSLVAFRGLDQPFGVNSYPPVSGFNLNPPYFSISSLISSSVLMWLLP